MDCRRTVAWHWLGASGYETAWSVECSSGKYVPERHQSSPAVSFLKKRSAILSKTHTSNALCAFLYRRVRSVWMIRNFTLDAIRDVVPEHKEEQIQDVFYSF